MSNSSFKVEEERGIMQAIRYNESGNLGASVKFAEENNDMIKYTDSNMEDAISIKEDELACKMDPDSEDVRLFDVDDDMLAEDEMGGFGKLDGNFSPLDEDAMEDVAGGAFGGDIAAKTEGNGAFKADGEPEVADATDVVKGGKELYDPSFGKDVLLPGAKGLLSNASHTVKAAANNGQDQNDDLSSAAINRVGRMAKNTAKNGYRLGKYGIGKFRIWRQNSLKARGMETNALKKKRGPLAKKLRKIRKNIARGFRESTVGKIISKITGAFSKAFRAIGNFFGSIRYYLVLGAKWILTAIVNLGTWLLVVDLILLLSAPLLYVIMELIMYSGTMASAAAGSAGTTISTEQISVAGVTVSGNVIDATGLSGEINLPGFVATDVDVMEEVYRYITKLDAELELSILNTSADIVIVNGVVTDKSNVSISSPIESIIAYLSTQFGDYTFDEDVEKAINKIHNFLYDVNYDIANSTLELTVNTWDDYFEKIFNDLSDSDKILVMGANLFGSYKCYQNLNPPFDLDWSQYITSRHGYRVDPFTNEIAIHSGIDIGMEEGTAVKTAFSGYASVAVDPDGYGNYVTVTSYDGSKEILYAHLSSAAVSDGDYISDGDVIGYVGTTGRSTGPHLHIQYYINGQEVNPIFYINCTSDDAGYNDFLDNLGSYEAYFSQDGILHEDINPDMIY